MSPQGCEGWFPECLACGMGNVGPVVCLDPTCYEQYEAEDGETLDEDTDERLIAQDGHWWKCCQLCDRRIHADPGAWGSFALCVGCFNAALRAGEMPPYCQSPPQRRERGD
jgi:hypothetical protein